MVVGAIIAYYAPSNRGFVKPKNTDDILFDSFYQDESSNFNNNDNSTRLSRNRSSMTGGGGTAATSGTVRRRKPLRAMAIITSIASDIDLIADWVFFHQSFKKDLEYRQEYAANPVDGELPYLVPKRLLICVFIFCIMGTIVYLALATEGRILAPCVKRLGIDKISMGFLLFCAVLLEDVPQIVLTFLVEDYYEEGQFLSQWAVVNLLASLYDTAIKLAESFDQRHDVVETGIWCKKSIKNAHKSTITTIFVLPEAIPLQKMDRQELSIDGPNLRNSASANIVGSTSSMPSSSRRMSQRSLLAEAFFPEEESMAPRIPFLTTGMDGYAKLWNVSSSGSSSSTSHMRISSSSLPSSDNECTRSYHDAQSKGFTCVAWIGRLVATNGPRRIFGNFFLTGCNNGTTKLWNVNGICTKTYGMKDANRVSSLATTTLKDQNYFLCGHESGVIRLWQTLGGGESCIQEIKAHEKRVSSILFVADNQKFVTASTDSTLKLWETSSLLPSPPTDQTPQVISAPTSEGESQNQNTADGTGATVTQPDNQTTDQVQPTRKFIGHTGAVLSMVCVDPKSAILSGSQDRTARLWSIESGVCLRVFYGHSDGVHSVLAIDRVTFLTGSADTTIKAWDALSGECLRTYTGHKNVVTGLSTAAVSKDETECASTFISSSADKTIKCWVLTAVSYRDPAATLDHILDLHDNTCRCFSAANHTHSLPAPVSLARSCSPEHCDFDHPYYHYEDPSTPVTSNGRIL